MAPELVRWKQEEVPIGILMHAFIGEETAPFQVEGSPATFLGLFGGVPMRRKIYAIKDGNPVMGTDTVEEGVTFSPANIYSPSDAPADKRYMVLSGGIFINNPKTEISFQVYKNNQNIIYDASFFPFHPHAASGNPMFEHQLKSHMARYMSVEEVIQSVEEDFKKISEYKEISNKSESLAGMMKEGIEDTEWRIDEKIAYITRQSGYSSDSEKLSLLNRLHIETKVAAIPDDARLVPRYNQ